MTSESMTLSNLCSQCAIKTFEVFSHHWTFLTITSKKRHLKFEHISQIHEQMLKLHKGFLRHPLHVIIMNYFYHDAYPFGDIPERPLETA